MAEKVLYHIAGNPGEFPFVDYCHYITNNILQSAMADPDSNESDVPKPQVKYTSRSS
jgi:hypothetical protein